MVPKRPTWPNGAVIAARGVGQGQRSVVPGARGVMAGAADGSPEVVVAAPETFFDRHPGALAVGLVRGEAIVAPDEVKLRGAVLGLEPTSGAAGRIPGQRPWPRPPRGSPPAAASRPLRTWHLPRGPRAAPSPGGRNRRGTASIGKRRRRLRWRGLPSPREVRKRRENGCRNVRVFEDGGPHRTGPHPDGRLRNPRTNRTPAGPRNPGAARR